MNKYKVVFMGTPDFAVPSLKALANDDQYEVIAVVTQPDKPAGRSGHLKSPAIKDAALELGLTVLQPEKIKTNDFIEQLKGLNPDVIVVAAYGKILPKEILEIPTGGAVNVHGSFLPKYRGASPITQAIIDGEKETGATIMKMSEGMDEGPILGFSKPVEINKDTTDTLMQKVALIGAEALVEILPKYLSGEVQPKNQDNKKATYVKLISKEDGLIDWTEDEEVIERKIRAYQPWPEAYTYWNGKMIKILDARVVEEVENIKGMAAKINKKLFVGKLQINLLQLEGKQPFTGEALMAGYPQIIGESVL